MNMNDKVVCVDDGPCMICGRTIVEIVRGMVYCVDGVKLSKLGKLTVSLVGVVPIQCHTIYEVSWFYAGRFRKLEAVPPKVRHVSEVDWKSAVDGMRKVI